MALIEAQHKASAIAESLHDLELRGAARSRIALACFAVAQQNHSALLQATAFSLLRKLMEAVLRGEWIAHCAIEEKIITFAIGGTRQTDMSSVTAALGKELNEPNAYSVLYQKTWSIVSAYTHTYESQVQYWLSMEDTSPGYTDEQVS